MHVVTHLGGARCTVGLALAFITFGGELRAAGLAALLANAMSHAAVQVLKRVVARPRPCDANGHPLALVALPDPFSFPSGHAAASASVGLVLTFAWPLTGVVALPVAAMVAWSRVALRVHHPGDVAGGVLLGAAGAVLARGIIL